MAAADEQLRAAEIDRLHRIAERLRPSSDTEHRLDGLLRILVTAPPTREDMVRRVIAWQDRSSLAMTLARDLASVARADDHLDEREEELLRLLTAAAGFAPATLHAEPAAALTGAEAAKLHRLRLELPA